VTWRSPQGVDCATCEVHGTVREVGAASVTLQHHSGSDDYGSNYLHTWSCTSHRLAKRWDSRVGQRVSLKLAYIPDSTYPDGYRMLAIGMRRLSK